MGRRDFFPAVVPLTVAEIATLVGAPSPDAADAAIGGIAALTDAGPGDLTFFDHPKYAEAARATRASACLVAERNRALLPAGVVAIIVRDPHAAFAQVSRRLFASAMRPRSLFGATGVAPGSFVHPSARIETGAFIDPGVVIGPEAEVGAGAVIAANAVIGPGVKIGRDSAIGAGASVTHAYLGNRVIVHPGARIGQDGFGFEPGRDGHRKTPQVGRVIIQDDVEIGANTTIDRGAVRDTVIGEGTKIDNLCQIAHNVAIGRHCILVAQVGISGSATLGDFVMLGGQVGVNNHVTVGSRAQIAATSIVKDDVPAGAIWGGRPAKPIRDWFREVAAVERLGQASREKGLPPFKEETGEGG